MESNATTLINAWLVFGLSGQVGQALQAALSRDDPTVLAVTREAHADVPGVRWLPGALDSFAGPDVPVAAIASLGPLDAFAAWFERSTLAPERIVALGSTSVHGKQASPDAGERRLAEVLRAAEDRLAAAAAARGSALTLLRPTLVYGAGRDQNISRVVRIARRMRWLPLPRRACGLRQPIHVADIAATVLRCLRAETAPTGRFDLPGGEALAFDEMVVRALAVGAPGARVLRVPGGMFRAAVRLARLSGRLGAAGEGVLARLDQDLAYDPAPARDRLGHAPRGFRPDAGSFPE